MLKKILAVSALTLAFGLAACDQNQQQAQQPSQKQQATPAQKGTENAPSSPSGSGGTAGQPSGSKPSGAGSQ